MGYKTILVHCDVDKAASRRLAVAAGLAQRFGAHLVGLHVRPPFQLPMSFDVGAAFPMDDFFRAYEESMKANEAAASAAFAAAIAGKDISTEWRAVDGFADAVLTDHARHADLVVLGQADADPSLLPADLPETVALACGRSILVVPYIGIARPPGKVVMLCWNNSREAARAASDALPFLQAADKVILLTIDPDSDSGNGVEHGAGVAGWLARQGVKAAIQHEVAPDADVGTLILSRAADLDVDLIVMGVYGHSRLRELVMGGASRTMLGSMTVPILMSH